MSEKGENLVAARGYVKGSLTRLYSFIKSEALFTSSITLLQTKKQRLLETFKQYERYNISILQDDPNDPENVEDQEEKYLYSLACLSDAILSKVSKKETPVNCTPIAQTKLPSIEIECFNELETRLNAVATGDVEWRRVLERAYRLGTK
ncbi:hypothetical protein ACJJTC_010160 [Scirpophaga incertulas]